MDEGSGGMEETGQVGKRHGGMKEGNGLKGK